MAMGSQPNSRTRRRFRCLMTIPFTAAAEATANQARTLASQKVVRVDSRSGRFYHIEGDDDPYVSVTHALSCIAKPALINWAANQERSLVMDASADLYQDLSK